jgi:SOS-response transcriptional repressor LexA
LYAEGIKQVPKGEIEAIIMEELGVHSTRKVKEYLAMLSRQMFLMPHPNNPNLIFLDRDHYYEVLNSINASRPLLRGGYSRAIIHF